MADLGSDMITKRPRTARDQYTVLTETQIKNIKQNPTAFFHTNKASDQHTRNWDPNKRYVIDRTATSTNQHLYRGMSLSHPVCWIGEKYNRFPPADHNTARLGASLRWGPEKTGSRTFSHFDGENSQRFVKIDMYKRPPTNQPGQVIMSYGRPGDGYYSQRNPNMTTWFGASFPLNRNVILEDIQPKTSADYEMIRQHKQAHISRRINQWPDFSEYTDKFALSTKTEPKITSLEQRKRYVLQA
ncbi:uncharacterized protein [Haliotis cracherodii]|uniref:uncharacterized protein n=1 Tax=Haliotis cracherodii TaxID=6455 RepID=UPI0039E755A1